MKRRKKIIIIIIIIIITGIILSLSIFNTPNFILSGIGVAKITFTNTEYTQIANNPKIYISKPNVDIIRTLEQLDYKFEEQHGSFYNFSKNGKKYIITYSVNKYFSLWQWDIQ